MTAALKALRCSASQCAAQGPSMREIITQTAMAASPHPLRCCSAVQCAAQGPSMSAIITNVVLLMDLLSPLRVWDNLAAMWV